MAAVSYQQRRSELLTYFDRTAADAWARLTSTAPVGKIRATVRAGRDSMRATLLDFLPGDLSGRRLLDAGCGTGAFSVAAAERSASVLAIDLSPTLVALARERLPQTLAAGSIDFRVGDMSDAALGEFDHVVAMASPSAPVIPSCSRSHRAHPPSPSCTPWDDCFPAAIAHPPSNRSRSGSCVSGSRASRNCSAGGSGARRASPAAFTNPKRWNW
jgi:SAM-dependent methyltransferase